ncbi:MAG: hypothetical protein MUF58_08670 [Arcicella sp.]|jgi:hypothetical protein|nr:hypothetical protein [Arcicella sp.]
MEKSKQIRNIDDIIHRLIADKIEMERQAREDYKKPHVQEAIKRLREKNKSNGNKYQSL